VGTPGEVNRPLLRAMAEHGLLDRLFAGEASAMELCLIREGLARHCTEVETAFAVQGSARIRSCRTKRSPGTGGRGWRRARRWPPSR
jgi:hypothetical protein